MRNVFVSHRDQFVVRLGEETEIYWNDAQRAMAEEVYRRSVWTESFVQWSPLGSMMATMHTKGVALWGSADFKRLQRVMHPGVCACFWWRRGFVLAHGRWEEYIWA